MMPPNEKPIMFIEEMYGFFFKYNMTSSAPLRPKVCISTFFYFINVSRDRKLIAVKVLMKDLILAMSFWLPL